MARSWNLWVAGIALALVLFVARSLEAQVTISEFMASNVSVLQDEDGDYSDWIEIYNAGDDPVNLAGWFLTDDADELDRWGFPAMDIEPGEFLIVFASGKDRSDADGELHTDFRLSGGGEDLLLANPRLRVSGARFDNYPRQQDDASYGALMQLSSQTIIETGAELKYHVPENNDLETTWLAPDFDDAAWTTGTTGIGFDVKDVPTLDDLIATDVGKLMHSESSSIFLRMRFDAGAADLNKFLNLRAKYNDGLGVALNGTQILLENMTRFSSTGRARVDRSGVESRTFASFAFTPADLDGALVEGENILAIQLVNRSSRGDDVLIVPELDFFEIEGVDTREKRFFASPSPGRPNSDPRRGIVPPPSFSHGGGMISGPTMVEISTPVGDTRIRYTTDLSIPTEASPLYEGPIEVDSTEVITAAVGRRHLGAAGRALRPGHRRRGRE
ncbi:MAG: lamin tail domain-containing protein, partial [Planctomycetota bacterium]